MNRITIEWETEVGHKMDGEKEVSGVHAASFVEDGMVLGLGTGSTVYYFLRELGNRVIDGLDVIGVPTSNATASACEKFGIRTTTLEEHPDLDLDIDGADEISPGLDLIKGGGGALFREKIVASASSHLIVVADSSKEVPVLGAFPLPVEVLPFGWRTVEMGLADLGALPSRRMAGAEPYITDNGNYILDCGFERIPEPARLETEIMLIPGVVECGLFVGMADMAVLGEGEDVKIIRRGQDGE